MTELAKFTASELFEFERRMGTVFRSDLMRQNLLSRIGQIHDADGWEAFLRSDRIAVCLLGNEHVKKLLASAARKAKLAGESSGFAQPSATCFLLSAVCTGVGVFNRYTQSGTTPEEITSADWADAIVAAKVLHRIKRKGLRIGGVFRGLVNQPPHDWLEQIIAGLEAGRKTAKRAYGDEFSADRFATRTFTDWMLTYFGDAPLTMVQSFARLIGYSEEAARKRLPQWLDDYRTNSLT